MYPMHRPAGVADNALRAVMQVREAERAENALALIGNMVGVGGPAADRLGSPVLDMGQPVDGDWLRYANQGAVRNQPLSPELANALAFLPEMGVTVEVFSGGQPGAGSGQPRVGSTRHDHGKAADVFFYKDGRRLDWRSPEDVPIYQEIVRRGRANGLTGFGAGPGYMQPGSMHIGFGTSAVWGDDGKGANAPNWLRTAYYG